MGYTSAVTGVAFVAMIVLAVLASRGRWSLTAAVARGLFVAAGLVALVGLLYVVQRAYPGQPEVYTMVRVVLAAALVGTFVRIVWLLR